MKAVILAGGAGTRLRPLTLDVPKPMIDINGKPFIQFIIEGLKKHGINDVVLCIGYLAEKFKGYFGDGSKFGIRIGYSVEEKYLGTAGALKLAENLLADDFILINGDTYIDIDYKDVYDGFKASNKLGLMVVYDNSYKVAEENINIDDNGLITAYCKKEPLKRGDKTIDIKLDKRKEYRYVDAGVYVFNKELLGLIKKDEFQSLEGDIYPELIEKRQLMAYVTSQRYYDLGTPERLEMIRSVLK